MKLVDAFKRDVFVFSHLIVIAGLLAGMVYVHEGLQSRKTSEGMTSKDKFLTDLTHRIPVN